MWESHADADDRRVVKPTPERAQPVYAVSELTLGPTEPVVAAVTGPTVGLANFETMLKLLLPAILAQAPPPLSAPTDVETMLIGLLLAVPAQAPSPRSAPTEIEAMLKQNASRNTDTGAATSSGDSPQRLDCSIVTITANGQVDARRWT